MRIGRCLLLLLGILQLLSCRYLLLLLLEQALTGSGCLVRSSCVMHVLALLALLQLRVGTLLPLLLVAVGGLLLLLLGEKLALGLLLLPSSFGGSLLLVSLLSGGFLKLASAHEQSLDTRWGRLVLLLILLSIGISRCRGELESMLRTERGRSRRAYVQKGATCGCRSLLLANYLLLCRRLTRPFLI